MKGLCYVICLQSYKGGLPGSIDMFGNGRMPDEFEEVHRKARETGTSLFRQWDIIYWCCKVGQGRDERRERSTPQLSVNRIKWQFNVSRAPWWVGQFKRIIGIAKSALHKSRGNGMLSWKEFQEVLTVRSFVSTLPWNLALRIRLCRHLCSRMWCLFHQRSTKFEWHLQCKSGLHLHHGNMAQKPHR